MSRCERCGAAIARNARVCRPCFHERQRNRAALERQDADRELLELVNRHPMSEVAYRLGVSTAAISKRVMAATERQERLRRIREDSQERLRRIREDIVR